MFWWQNWLLKYQNPNKSQTNSSCNTFPCSLSFESWACCFNNMVHAPPADSAPLPSSLWGTKKNMWAQLRSPATKQVLRKVPVVSVQNSNLLSDSRPRKTPHPTRADVIQQNTPCKKRQTDPNWERQDNKQLLPHVKIRFPTNRTVATEDVLYHFKGTWERFGLTVTMKIFPWKKENQNLGKA